jgi:hypothetical protein
MASSGAGRDGVAAVNPEPVPLGELVYHRNRFLMIDRRF